MYVYSTFYIRIAAQNVSQQRNQMHQVLHKRHRMNNNTSNNKENNHCCSCSTNTENQTLGLYRMFRINVLHSVPILFCPSLSLIVVHTLAHRLLSSHQGKYPLSVRKMEWNRWHQNDWNHLQWFPQLPYLCTPLSLICWLLPSPRPLPRSRFPAQLHPSSECTIPASSMPSRLTGLAKEAQARWKPHGATQSQPRGEREEGGVQGGEERWREEEATALVFFPPPTWNRALILAALFLAHHTFTCEYQ